MSTLPNLTAASASVDTRCACSGPFTCTPVPSFVCHRDVAHVGSSGDSLIAPALNSPAKSTIRKDMQSTHIIFSVAGVQ